MTTTTASAALVPVQPVFNNAERLALAGFLAGYRGLTREAYALDLRQFTTWCRARALPLFAVRRADIGSFARDLEDSSRGPRHGHPSAVHHRRVLPVRGRGGTAGTLPGRACPPAPAGLRVPRGRAGPQRARRAAGGRRAGSPSEHALISLLALNGLRVSEAIGADIEHLDLERGHRTLTITRKGGKVVTIPLARAPRGRSTWPSANAARGRSPSPATAVGWTVMAPGDRPPGRRPCRDPQGRQPSHAQARLHHRRAGCRGAVARRAGSRLSRGSAYHDPVRPGPRQLGPARHIHRRRLPRGSRPVTSS